MSKPASLGHSLLDEGMSLSPLAADIGLTLIVPTALANTPAFRQILPLYLFRTQVA